ncbi:MAG: TraR/DksA family transcriptional regulator [Bdellovibrionia bacterium]
MKKETIRKFKKIFETQRDKILLNNRVAREDFSVCADDRYDEIDQATTDIEQSMRMRLRNRETLYIKKIDEALRRIEEGTFGECDECQEDIELRRLEARPTATLCVFCKEEQERKEILTAVGREHKSLGTTFSRKLA